MSSLYIHHDNSTMRIVVAVWTLQSKHSHGSFGHARGVDFSDALACNGTYIKWITVVILPLKDFLSYPWALHNFARGFQLKGLDGLPKAGVPRRTCSTDLWGHGLRDVSLLATESDLCAFVFLVGLLGGRWSFGDGFWCTCVRKLKLQQRSWALKLWECSLGFPGVHSS